MMDNDMTSPPTFKTLGNPSCQWFGVGGRLGTSLKVIRLLPLLAALTLAGCGKISSRVRHPLRGADEFRQEGVASWYGKDFHGRPTANGEIYDMENLTAAHRTLPLGVWADVTHLDNGRTVRVWINDRGPFVKGRIIDMSRGAARELGMLEDGVARVRVVVSGEQRKIARVRLQGRLYTLQVGSFGVKANAERLRDSLQPKHDHVYIAKYRSRSRTWYRVRVGKFNDDDAARVIAQRLEDDGFEPLLTTR